MSISAKSKGGGACRRGTPAAILALGALLAACAVGPDFQRPDPSAADHYNAGGDPTVAGAAATPGGAQTLAPAPALADPTPPPGWWDLFQSPALTAMMAQAARDNPGVQGAQAALRASQAALRAGYGVFYPSIDGGFAATRETTTPVRQGQALPGGLFNLFTLSASVSYALDVFGGERRMVEELGAEVDLQQAQARATWLTISGNIATAAIARAAYAAEIAATTDMVARLKDQVRLSEVQAAAGTVSYAAVLSLRSQLASVEASLPALEQKFDQTGTLLATLVGQVPAAWTPPDLDLDGLTLPHSLPVSLPSDLTRQRPDIQMAEASLHAASAAIGVATAALLPSVTLNAGYGANGNAMNTLFAQSGRAWSAGGSVTTPIFEGGTLWARRQQALATYDQEEAAYRQTVLAAFQQVADTLKALAHDAAAADAQDRALAAADQNLRLVQANYAAGLVAYDQMLIADVQYLQARISHIQAVAARHQDSVALFTALGGGWWNDPGPLKQPDQGSALNPPKAGGLWKPLL